MTEIVFRSGMGVEYISHMGSDETVARSARVSTGKDQLEQGKIEGLINFLVREGHTSTLEHCTITFRVNVPISTHRQIMTHRTLAKNSESGRYTELKPHFYVPEENRPLVNKGTSARPELVHGDSTLSEYVRDRHKALAENAWAEYQTALKLGVAKEVARDYLPVTTYTSAYLTANLLGWFNFLRLRNGQEGHPQTEIVDVARQVEEIISDLFPVTYQAWIKTQ